MQTAAPVAELTDDSKSGGHHRIGLIGLGAIGTALAGAITAQAGLELVGLVDIHSDKVGKRLDEFVEPGPFATAEERSLVAADGIDALIETRPDVVIVSAPVPLADIGHLLKRLLEAGVAVLSSNEHLTWPWYAHIDLAESLDAAAKRGGVALLGAGVNPGFVMDVLGVGASCMLRRVTAVHCLRRVDASLRRDTLQHRAGIGLTIEQFEERRKEGKVGHLGLAESAAMLAAGLGRAVEPNSVTEHLESIRAPREIRWKQGEIAPGLVCGMRHAAQWASPDDDDMPPLSIELTMEIAAELADPVDVVKLEGPVPLTVKVPGGVPGDSSTVAALLNHIPAVRAAKPGLRHLLELPRAGCVGANRR